MVSAYDWERISARLRGGGRRATVGCTPMRVLAVARGGGTLARCAGADGVPATVETALIAPLEAGAVVLVHAGVALARLDGDWAT